MKVKEGRHAKEECLRRIVQPRNVACPRLPPQLFTTCRRSIRNATSATYTSANWEEENERCRKRPRQMPLANMSGRHVAVLFQMLSMGKLSGVCEPSTHARPASCHHAVFGHGRGGRRSA